MSSLDRSHGVRLASLRSFGIIIFVYPAISRALEAYKGAERLLELPEWRACFVERNLKGELERDCLVSV
ncbi:hypothetical protein PM082_008247 [Marasmius tenuissimus]|nr:hypothetical protein PM082_008247 [Marasmius tenuissimus]